LILLLPAVFFGTLAIIVGGYVFLNRKTLAQADVARDRLRPREAGDRVIPLLKDVRVSEVNLINRLLAGKSWVEELQLQLARAGTSMKPGAFVMLVLAFGIIATFIAAGVASPAFALFLFISGWSLPFLWLRRKQKKRLTVFESQIPDAIDMLVSAMKAGYSFQAAAQFIGDELPAPAGPEFARFYDEQRLGIDVRTALMSMQERIDSLDLKMFVTAVLIQRETGGNLAEVLSNLADLIRERIAMRGHIETLVAEPKMSARVLAVLPVIVYLLLSVFSPHFMDPMIQSPGGQMALALAATSVLVGYWIMMRIADVDI
jgi:tight adherence protein B